MTEFENIVIGKSSVPALIVPAVWAILPPADITVIVLPLAVTLAFSVAAPPLAVIDVSPAEVIAAFVVTVWEAVSDAFPAAVSVPLVVSVRLPSLAVRTRSPVVVSIVPFAVRLVAAVSFTEAPSTSPATADAVTSPPSVTSSRPTFSAPALLTSTVPEALILPRKSVPFVEASLVRPSM